MKHYALPTVLASLLLTACDSQPARDTAPPGTAAGDVAGDDSPAEDSALLGLYPDSRATAAADRFTTADGIDRVVAWYRDDSARRREMMYVSTERQANGYLVIYTAGEEGRSFALKLTPGPTGGTEMQVLPYDPTKGLTL